MSDNYMVGARYVFIISRRVYGRQNENDFLVHPPGLGSTGTPESSAGSLYYNIIVVLLFFVGGGCDVCETDFVLYHYNIIIYTTAVRIMCIVGKTKRANRDIRARDERVRRAIRKQTAHTTARNDVMTIIILKCLPIALFCRTVNRRFRLESPNNKRVVN